MKTLRRTTISMCTIAATAMAFGCSRGDYGDHRGNLNRGNVEAAQRVPAEKPTLTEQPAAPAAVPPSAFGGGPAAPSVAPTVRSPIQPGGANPMQGGAAGGPGGYSSSGK